MSLGPGIALAERGLVPTPLLRLRERVEAASPPEVVTSPCITTSSCSEMAETPLLVARTR